MSKPNHITQQLIIALKEQDILSDEIVFDELLYDAKSMDEFINNLKARIQIAESEADEIAYFEKALICHALDDIDWTFLAEPYWNYKTMKFNEKKYGKG